MSHESTSNQSTAFREQRGARQLSPFWTLFILTGLNLFNYLDRFVVSAVLTPIREEFRVSDGDLGRINTIFMIGYFLTSPLFGYLGDRASRKWLIAGGIFVWSLGTVLTGYATSFAWLLSYRVLVGVGEASYATISPSLISDTFPPARRNNALTIFYVAIPVGAALGNIIGGQVAAHQGWRNAFIWAGLPGLLLALLLLPFREPVRGQADGTHVEKPKVGDVWKLFRLADFNLVVWGYTAYTFAMGAFGVCTQAFYTGSMGWQTNLRRPSSAESWWLPDWSERSSAGSPRRLGRKDIRLVMPGVLFLSVMLAVPVATAAFMTRDKTIAMSCLGAAMFFIFLCTGPVNTLILESVPVNLRSSAMAMSIFLIHLFGDMWSSEIVGHLSDSWASLQKAVMILPAALGVAAFLWLALALKTKPIPKPIGTTAL